MTSSADNLPEGCRTGRFDSCDAVAAAGQGDDVRAEHWIDYEERFDVVLAHVHDHLAEPLDLVVLAQVAGLAPRHFHRVFTSAFDETLAALVRRLRMQRASDLLANSTTPVAQVAALCGYPDVFPASSDAHASCHASMMRVRSFSGAGTPRAGSAGS